MEKPGQAMSEIACSGCGATGHATWALSGAHRLESLSDNFKPASGAGESPLVVVCNACGANSTVSAA
ncbi:MAG TPA: hypothetical protein VMU31_09865 [Rhizomicrobium sp.]|nr:hypothetical protein [Rhizomicrobium sp.]